MYGRSSFKVWSSLGTVHSSKGVIGLGGFFSIGTPGYNVVYVYDKNGENMLPRNDLAEGVGPFIRCIIL